MALLLFKKKHRNLAQMAIVRDGSFLTSGKEYILGFFCFNERFSQTLPYMLCFRYVFVKHLFANGYRDNETFP